jgi:hypothetical protein
MLHHANAQWVVHFQCSVLVTQVKQDPNKIQKIAEKYTMYSQWHIYIILHSRHSHVRLSSLIWLESPLITIVTTHTNLQLDLDLDF